jgi:hypothetical protein
MALEAVVLVSVSIAAGAHLATVTTGVLSFGLYGLAFIGGWVEQIGLDRRQSVGAERGHRGESDHAVRSTLAAGVLAHAAEHHA